MHSIRVVCIDTYQAAPIAEVDPTFAQFRGSEIKQVPIIRIFGINPAGEKTCLHVHGTFPYMYVPYTGQTKPEILSYQLSVAIDAAINVSLGSARANTQHVYKIQQVSGIPFYGYHRKKHHFLKIYFYNPAMMKRATDLLQTGCILEQVFQPHEAHIPFTLQFMMDYNIYGMSMINLKNAKYRHDVSSSQDEIRSSQNSDSILNPQIETKDYLPYTVLKQSTCQIEIDAWASDIINREVIDKGIDINPGIAAIWEEEKARRAQAGLGGNSQLTNPPSPSRSQGANVLTDDDVYYRTRLIQRLCALESQPDETILSPSLENMSYPVPVPNNSNLLNASQLEIHAGPFDLTFNEQSQNQFQANESIISQTQNSVGDVSLDTSDLNIADILASLARAQDDSSSPIESNSILGTQVSQADLDHEVLSQPDLADNEDDEEVPDLNMTNLQLDNFNWSPWENINDKSESQSSINNESQFELVLESAKDQALPDSPKVPQLDGPIDDENARSSFDDNDVTIESKEMKVCEYKSNKKSLCVTPRKRKRTTSSEDDNSSNDSNNKKPMPGSRTPRTPRTPRRSGIKKINGKLTSPSCPNRTYSPLSVEICKTPKRSPKVDSTTPRLQSSGLSKKNLRQARKNIFSPLKELNEETPEKNTELNSPEDLNDSLSDKTLVEDSDESTHTIASSPIQNDIIINDSDYNDSCDSKSSEKLGSYFISWGKALNKKINKIDKLSEEKNESNDKTISAEDDCEDDVTICDKHKEVDIDREALPISSESSKSTHSYLDIVSPFRMTSEESTSSSNLEITKSKELVPIELPPDLKDAESWVTEMKKKALEELKEKAKTSRKESQKSQNICNSLLSDQSINLSRIFFDIDSNESSKHLGVSCGQLEFTNRASISNAAHENLGNAKAMTNHQFLTTFCLEIHVNTRPNMLPDPRHDPINAVFYAIHNDVPLDWTKSKPLDCGIIIVNSNDPKFANEKSIGEHSITYVDSEQQIFDALVAVIRRTDPDILVGWDIEFLSWGYTFQRASLLGKSLSGKISRIPSAKCNWESAKDEPMEIHLEILAEVRLPGRIVLDVWRIMRHEIALYSYTYENIMYHILNERVPHPNFDVLSKWWNEPVSRWRVLDHYINRVIGVHRLLHHLDIINRTSEHARLYGVQFFEVFSRGSQFRVESMMLRLAKPMNYIPVSPSPHQRASMRAPESLPLIMEPESTMYLDPVVVLDFQSLYPSIIIAYNYCFSTCLGRVEHIGSPHPYEFGCTSLKVQKALAKKLQNKLNYAPCGVAFVKEEVRKGILPQMLTEILETRFMVKKAIKDHPKEEKSLQRALHSRQLGLKLIANVTYGYTAANFSGRMPCIEVGDSVVSKGKETLERAIKLVQSTPKWGARVIYGDTDSLFILLKGKSREEAFVIGQEMADAVTAVNPKPVKLKFEKVLHPCILQTKKRYCGYMYENVNDKPVYLAKGIETVRRDGCPAVAKILEKSLRVLFETNDTTKVKEYVTRQLDKILSGRASIQDLTFAKEFRGVKGYKAAACVPALELTKRFIQKDPRAVPRTGSRVPYIIVAGAPNEPLIKCVKSPSELIQDPYLRPNATYYITKVIIPPLNRCLKLIGVDAYAWFMEMPHRQAPNRLPGVAFINHNRKQKTTISQYLCNVTCPSCGLISDRGICEDCIKNQSRTLVTLHEKCRQYDRIHSNIKMICSSCIGIMDTESCTSLDCSIYYRRIQSQRDSAQISYFYDLIQCMEHL